MPSTPKSGSFRSLRLSDEEEDAVSQAITSGGEEEDEEEAVAGSMADARGSALELVMPSLSMPSRRPFTERGKQMGRLKIAVAGANGMNYTNCSLRHCLLTDAQALARRVSSEQLFDNAKTSYI
jgi:hypothetical protein